MADLRINTELVVTTAEKIKRRNDKMNEDFADVKAAISRLDGNWDGSAATNAINKFNELQTKFVEARYNVIDNFVKFLMNQVGEGYTRTEEVNVSLADRFK